jgi:protein gp37
MGVNKTSGNMYDWAETVNFYGGACREYGYRCRWCYTSKGRISRMPKYQGKLRLWDKAFKPLKSDKVIFVNSCTDLCHNSVSDKMIATVLAHINKYPDNIYLLQSQNVSRLYQFFDPMSEWGIPTENIIFGTTIQTNYQIPGWSYAPKPIERAMSLLSLPGEWRTMVSIEPVMLMNVDIMVTWIRWIRPEFVSIGANTNRKIEIPEPTQEQVESLIDKLGQYTEVRVKSNMKRLLGHE